MNTRLVRVAFRAQGGEQWSAGYTYQNYFLEALRQYAPNVEVCIVNNNGSSAPSDKTQAFYGGAVTLQHTGLWARAGQLPNRIVRRLLGLDVLLRRTLMARSDRRTDVIFPDSCTVSRKTAAVAWIPDFQHVHLPEMFAPAERNWRDQGYRRLSRQATLVVLSSRNAQEDFEGFAYTERHKARVMPFVASVPETIRMQDPRDVTLRYRLPLDFIFLPNQFWRHKNHLAVFEALSILKTKGVKPYVVCSGNMSDVRNPTHVGEMIRQIAALGLRDQVAMLGLIPHDHVMLLARQAKCVLNPSLFEGWSTTVEEAKSIGKRVLLSNIRVHLEQDPPGALFFDPKNAEDLADKLHYVWTNWPSGPDAALEMEASNKLPDRMRSYAETFVSIATEAIEMVQGKK